MKLLCVFIIATLTVLTHARNDKYYAGKYRAPIGIAKHKQPTKVKASDANLLQKRNDYKRPNSISGSYAEGKVPILQNDQQMRKDGSYHYQYETGNGISGMERGTGGVSVQGISSYVSPEGVPIKLSYTADETGYHPVGDHIPKTPDYVFRALEYIRTHPFKVAKRGVAQPQLSVEIAPPLHTPANARNFNYKTSSSGRTNRPTKSRTQRGNTRRFNDLRRRF
ncbi:pupal cuticle protein [Anastrepha ludens]|uniref:pupal cuticle protein n=1 Tax=Anastrepha ludens TaxID=28586 RepID=UPI0023B13F78|nr:pupal cuticle protein [Anastrepha ludens]